jgi:Rrf2 family protein
MRLTSQEEYGLRCLLQVARASGSERTISIREVATAEGLGVEYAAKMLSALRKAELVESRRGARGGYRLCGAPHEVTVWAVLEALDGAPFTEDFCDGHGGQLPVCVHSGMGCSVRVLWRWVGGALRTALERVTLADLLAGSGPVVGALSGARQEPVWAEGGSAS